MAGSDPEIVEYLIYQPEYLMVILGGSMIQIFFDIGGFYMMLGGSPEIFMSLII